MLSRLRSYQPAPRYGHRTVLVNGSLYLWGGMQKNLPRVCSSREMKAFTSVVEVYKIANGLWKQLATRGTPPLGIYGYSCAVIGSKIYYYGGNCGSCRHSNLTSLNTENMEWEEVTPATTEELWPRKRSRCGMVSFECDDEDFLHVVGGYGPLPSAPPPQFQYTPRVSTLRSGWTNEQLIFSLQTGQWVLPTITGQPPLPCQGFSYTSVNKRKAIMFGGYQPHIKQRTSDVRVAEFSKDAVHWIKLSIRADLRAVGRRDHAACCITGLQLMVVGGVDNNSKTLSNSFVMSVAGAEVKQISLPESVTQRQEHSMTVFSLSAHCVLVVLFGGVRKWSNGESYREQSSIADTAVVELVSSSGEWGVRKVYTSYTLGSEDYTQAMCDQLMKTVLAAQQQTPSVEATAVEELESLVTKLEEDKQQQLLVKEEEVKQLLIQFEEEKRMAEERVEKERKQVEERIEEEMRCVQQLFEQEHQQKMEKQEMIELLQTQLEEERRMAVDRTEKERRHVQRLFEQECQHKMEKQEEIKQLQTQLEEERRMADERIKEERRKAGILQDQLEQVCHHKTKEIELLQTQLEEERTMSEEMLEQERKKAQETLEEERREAGVFQQRLVQERRQKQEAEEEVARLRLQVMEVTRSADREQHHWIVRREEVTMTEEVVGTGGWGVVRVAKFRGIRVVAKALHGEILSDFNRELFNREMSMAAILRHPNLLQFIGAVTEGTPIILTEVMPTNLREQLKKEQLPHNHILSISQDVCLALNYLHLFTPDPIIHRDLSSPNVLLEHTPNGWRAKVSDFGTANFTGHTATAYPGAMIYGAPEAKNPNEHSPKMDTFSFGVLLIEMVRHQPPGMTSAEKARQVCEIQWADMSFLIRCCLSHSPSDRPNMEFILTTLSNMIPPH